MIKLFRAIIILSVFILSVLNTPDYYANAQEFLPCSNIKTDYKKGDKCINLTGDLVSVPSCGTRSPFCYTDSQGGSGSSFDGGPTESFAPITSGPADKSGSGYSDVGLCTGVGTVYILWVDKGACLIWAGVLSFLLSLMAGLTAITATLFDTVMQKFILQISSLFLTETITANGTQIIGGDKEYIYGAWTVMRDLGNIIAFFGAVYMGFRYIIGKDDLDFKKAVMKLVFYSLMVNFSFPIAKFLIDISNVVSLQIYGGITKYSVGGGELKNMIMESVGVSYLVSDVGKVNSSFVSLNSFTVLSLAIIYLFLTFGVFLYASLQVIIRAFILIACVIFSPIMFLNFAFPKIAELHEKWRENFFGQLFFMPMLMIGFWLSFTLLSVATTGSGDLANVNLSNTNESSFLSIVNMSLAIVALIMGIKLSSAASGGIGKYASGVVGGAMKEVGLGVATGGVGSLARLSVGKMGAKMAASKWTKYGDENGALRRMSGAMLKNVGGKMAGFSAFGKDSYKVKTEKTLDKEKLDLKNTNFEGLKDTGLAKLLDEAKTVEEVEKVKAEMEHRVSNTNKDSWNKDVLGRAEAKRKFNAEQSRLKEMRVGGVASALRETFNIEKDSIEKEEKMLEELIAVEKTKQLDSSQILQKSGLESLIKARKDKIDNELKGSSLAYKIGAGLGDATGEAKVGVSRAKDELLDATGITGAKITIGRGLDAAGKAVSNFADAPSVLTVAKGAAANNFRSKTSAREKEREEELRQMEEDKSSASSATTETSAANGKANTNTPAQPRTTTAAEL